MRPDLLPLKQMAAPALPLTPMAALTTAELTNADQAEVVEFLDARPVHTVVMAGFVRDHGLESELNRGKFFGCRDRAGALVGVALIGHGIFLESRCDAALTEFARIAQGFSRAHMVLGEHKTIGRFWRSYRDGGQPVRRVAREILFEMRQPRKVFAAVPELRPATADELSLVMPVHAALAFDESGVNPLDIDRSGFEKRCLRRIEQKRVWVWIEGGEVIFKADVVATTPRASYIEGVYVNSQHRRKGLGSRCLSQMAHEFLRGTTSVTALINETDRGAQRFFQRVGFRARSLYDTIFLKRTEQSNMAS